MSREAPRPPKPGYQRFRMLVAYDGADYYGWQRLVHRSPTIQEVLEDALSQFFNEKITVIGSGRTDSGVHAFAQQAHFDAIPDPARVERLCHALRRMIPPSIIIKGMWLAPPNFHAIWSVLKKSYIYSIETGPFPTVLNSRYSLWVHYPLDIDYLRSCSQFLVGNQDFKSFMTSGSSVKSTIREIYSAEWSQPKKNQLVFKITGNGFLKQMVRNVVGTLITLNKRQTPPEAVTEILKAKDRQKALWTAPAKGLILTKVFYPPDLDIQCRKI